MTVCRGMLLDSRSTFGSRDTIDACGGCPALVGEKRVGTHAVTIDATPEQIWPWITKLGSGRRGFYGLADDVTNPHHEDGVGLSPRYVETVERTVSAGVGAGHGGAVPDGHGRPVSRRVPDGIRPPSPSGCRSTSGCICDP